MSRAQVRTALSSKQFTAARLNSTSCLYSQNLLTLIFYIKLELLCLSTTIVIIIVVVILTAP